MDVAILDPVEAETGWSTWRHIGRRFLPQAPGAAPAEHACAEATPP
jgi:hypothetical protein